MITNTTTRTETVTKILFNGEDIVAALKAVGKIPSDSTCEVEFKVPGGDWSNMSVEVTNEHPVVVFFKKVEVK